MLRNSRFQQLHCRRKYTIRARIATAGSFLRTGHRCVRRWLPEWPAC